MFLRRSSQRSIASSLTSYQSSSPFSSNNFCNRQVLPILKYVHAHLGFVINMAIARGVHAAIETGVAFRHFRDPDKEPLMSEQAYLGVTILFQVMSLYAQFCLATRDRLEASGRLIELESDDDSFFNESSSLLSHAPVERSTLNKTARYGLFLVLAGLSLSLSGPFTYRALSEVSENFFGNDLSLPVTNLLTAVVTILTIWINSSFLLINGGAIFEDLCAPPEAEKSSPLSLRGKIAVGVLGILIYLIHMLFFVFEGVYAFNLQDENDDNCLSFFATEQLPLTTYVLFAANALALFVAWFETKKIVQFTSTGLNPFTLKSKKEQLITVFSLIMTLGGAVGHASPSVAESKHLLGCFDVDPTVILVTALILLTLESATECRVDAPSVKEITYAPFKSQQVLIPLMWNQYHQNGNRIEDENFRKRFVNDSDSENSRVQNYDTASINSSSSTRTRLDW